VSLPQSALYDVLLLKTLRVHAPETPSPRLPNPWAACHAAPEVVLSGPRCNKFVNRLFKFLVFFYKLKYICHQNTPKLTCCFCYGPTTQKLVLKTLRKYDNFLDLVYIRTS